MASLVEKIVEISVLAGAEIMKIYKGSEDWEVESKSDDSPLTRADKQANDLIVARLQMLDQQYPIISEENKLQEYEERRGFKKFWLVDPLDGTKEFIKRNGEFTVNIALVEDGQPVLGVVYVPVSGDIYYAEKDKGAFHKKGDGAPTEMKANSYSTSDKGLRVVCSRSHINDATQAYIDQLSEPNTVSKGSSLKFMLLASGQAEVYPRMGPTMEWDTGAAHIVLEEAGGKVINVETDQPLGYNKENLLNPHFIAYANVQS